MDGLHDFCLLLGCQRVVFSLPVLPENLETLHCFNKQLNSLPVLPENLVSLDCINNGYYHLLP